MQIKISLFGFQSSLNPKHLLSISTFFMGHINVFLEPIIIQALHIYLFSSVI